MGSEFTFDLQPVAEYEEALTEMQKFSEYVRCNPSFTMDHPAEALQLFGDFGREIRITEGEHGDDIHVDEICGAHDILDRDGNPTGTKWNSALISAVAGRHKAFCERLENLQPQWEAPEMFPEVSTDPSALTRALSKEAVAKTAEAAEVVAQYVE